MRFKNLIVPLMLIAIFAFIMTGCQEDTDLTGPGSGDLSIVIDDPGTDVDPDDGTGTDPVLTECWSETETAWGGDQAFAGSNWALYLVFNTQNDTQEFDLTAGQNIDAGRIVVTILSETQLQVEYITENLWYIVATHLHVASSVDGIPHTRRGSPIPGRFDNYGEYNPYVNSVVYTVDYEPDANGNVYVAAHAVVLQNIVCPE